MNIGQAKDYIFSVARKNQIGYLNINNFNLYASRAQLDKIEKLRLQYELTSIIADELSPIIKIIEQPLDSDGKFVKPNDYIYSVNIESFIFKNPSDCTANDGYNTWTEVKRVTQDRKNYYLNSAIVQPDNNYPIAIDFGSAFDVYPKKGGMRYRLTYISNPVPPVWSGAGVPPVYDPLTSVDWVLPEITHNELCATILAYIGISIRDGELYQGANAEREKGGMT